MLFATLAVLALVTISPRGARACGQGSNYGGGGYAAVAAVALAAAPQVGLGIAGLSSGQNTGFFAFYTAWMALLTTHGIWTIATAAPARTTTIETTPPEAVVPREPAAEMQLTVGPTYVPVGQLAQPGFGLVGRF
jgi:hypothetical protein